jgi:hypothetical protein
MYANPELPDVCNLLTIRKDSWLPGQLEGIFLLVWLNVKANV